MGALLDETLVAPAKYRPMSNSEGVRTRAPIPQLRKTATGIHGFDEVTAGGLPTGRTSLVCGSAGCGKTLFAMEFLVHGALQYGEAGVFFAFEESEQDLRINVGSLGFDITDLERQGKFLTEHIKLDRSEIEEAGDFDLEGLFLRLGLAIDSIGAKRVVLDTIETLYSAFTNESVLRAELRRLFGWLKDRGVTAVVTAERGEGQFTRQGLEEYVSDCVILLDHRTIDQVSTRRLRVVKYRGTSHGTNEYPFIIDESGISVIPITSQALNHAVSTERVSTGVTRLDAMLEGGFYRGSSVLVSGTAGTGKSSLAGHFAFATCKQGERCLYLAFEESPDQIVRNLRSIGIDLQSARDSGLLLFHAARPTMFGLESHLATMFRLVAEFEPEVVVVDPISNFSVGSSGAQAQSLLLRLVDHLKSKQITAFFTCLTSGTQNLEQTEAGISSICDTWLLLRDIELGGERNRGLYVLKSRGTAHSNQIREFLLTASGIQLLDVYVGPDGVLTGSMRLAQERREQERELAAQRAERLHAQKRARRLAELRAQISVLEHELEAEEEESKVDTKDSRERRQNLAEGREEMAVSRRADVGVVR